MPNRLDLTRRSFAIAAFAASTVHAKAQPRPAAIFDCHMHIIDPHYPLIANEGYLPPPQTIADYRAKATPLGIRAGAVVSGSFQGYDQTYLRATLAALGSSWVGVTQIPDDMPDPAIAALGQAGVRALRFNMFRGVIGSLDALIALATRAHAVANWHPEIYTDAAALAPHVARLVKLPASIVIDHLGMTAAGLPVLLDLVDAGAKVKATGFGRVSMDVPKTLEAIAARDPSALMFGTDLPSTRARRPFQAADITLIRDVLGAELAQRALWDNAVAKYRLTPERP